MLSKILFLSVLGPVILAVPWDGGSSTAPWGAGHTAFPCSARVNALVAGIQINILGQQGERNATEQLQAIEAAKPYNATAFAAGKAVLLSDIAFGMDIRAYNQRLAPEGNGAIPGLAKYASAQATEQDLANSLNGDATHDAPILAMLVSDITTGIQLNENNTKAATSQCYTSLIPEFLVPI